MSEKIREPMILDFLNGRVSSSTFTSVWDTQTKVDGLLKATNSSVLSFGAYADTLRNEYPSGMLLDERICEYFQFLINWLNQEDANWKDYKEFVIPKNTPGAFSLPIRPYFHLSLHSLLSLIEKLAHDDERFQALFLTIPGYADINHFQSRKIPLKKRR